MPTLTIPNSFTPNTVAFSAQVNANFNAVATLLNSTLLDHTNIQTGGLTAVSLASGAVTAVKLASDVVDGTTTALNGSNAIEIAAGGVDTTQLAAAVLNALIPTGVTLEYYGTSAPTGFLLCDGAAVSRSTYSALFAVIGVSCGIGNGTTTFNVPDHRGYFIRGTDNMGSGAAARDPNAGSRTAMGTSGNTGNSVGSVQAGGNAAHTHGSTFSQGFVGWVTGGDGGTLNSGFGGGPSAPTTQNTAASGGSESRPVNAYANKIIKI